ncbi:MULTISPECIES: flagellin lysine-N-methylase [Pantoea]|uniref:Lysine-N-methylase fliB n=1 Tax=Pantoea endophytica TaxID=92488 RepID=A0ABX4SL82_9GAMM|nr:MULTISPECIES: flagellin lysine-N-methylase [Pantoea]PLR20447.1 lysine-N-methylase fliB [Pantoea endophytica]
MKEIAITEPVFVTTFQCVGSDCREHCCGGWDIYLDKSSVSKYLNSQKIEIKQIATEHINVHKKGHANWGVMKLNDEGNCAFIDEQKLCKVHKELGAKALSPTCATYPRAQNTSKREVSKTLTLSCPEAARLVLTDLDSMALQQRTELQKQFNSEQEIKDEKKLLNLMCATLMRQSDIRIEQGLYSVAMLFLMLDKLPAGAPDNFARLEHVFVSLLQGLESHATENNMQSLQPNVELQWALMLHLQSFIRQRSAARGRNTLGRYIDPLHHFQADITSKEMKAVKLAELDQLWQQRVEPWLAQRPWVINNYLQYRIYNDAFPGYASRTPLACLYLLTAEWRLLRAMIALSVLDRSEPDEQDIINIIYSFHAVTKHNKAIMDIFFQRIDEFKMNDDLSLLCLLN